MRNHVLALACAIALLSLVQPAAANAGVTTLNPSESADVVTVTLSPGDSVEYQWSTGLAVKFRISRSGVEVFSTTGPVGQGTYAVTQGGEHVVSFRNDGSYLTIVSWNVEPHVQASTLPLLVGAAAAGALGLVLGLVLWRRRKAGAPGTIGPPASPPQNPGG